MKNKLWNQFIIHMCVKMFSNDLFTLSNFPHGDAITLWNKRHQINS
jgi:hypothetical protein